MWEDERRNITEYPGSMNERITRWLLFIVIFIFSVISAYTTKFGFSMVWGGEDDTPNMLISWGMAIGISLLMIYISLRVIDFQRKNFWGLVVGYFCVASVSVFFNFNAIHGRKSTAISLREDVELLRSSSISMRTEGVNALKEHFQIQALEKEVGSLLAEMKIEENHYERPGKGPKYHDLQGEYERKSIDLNLAQKEYTSTEQSIEVTYEQLLKILDDAISIDDEALYVNVISEGKKLYETIHALIKSYISNFNMPLPSTFISVQAGRPDYSFNTIFISLKSLFSESPEVNQEEKMRVILSILISLVIDFPIFFSLVMLHWPSHISITTRLRNILFRPKPRTLFQKDGKEQRRFWGER